MSERGDGEGGGDRFRPSVANDLRETIAAAIESETAAPEGGASEASEASRTPAPAEHIERERSSERRAGEERRTSSTAGTPERTAAEEPPATPTAPAEEPGGAPAHWSAADKATFNALPDAAKSPFLDLYKRMESGFTPKLQRGAQLERDYGALDQSLFTPQIREVLRAKGINEPRQMVEAWAQVEMGLINRATVNGVLARLIHAYQADPSAIAETLGQLRGGGGNGLPPVDPALAARLERLEAAHHSRTVADQQSAVATAQAKIDAFAAATDAAGNPSHPHFLEVQGEMTRLGQLDNAAGKPLDLEDLYQRAAWSNPKIRAELIAAERTGAENKGREERRAHAERARRAGASVSGAPGPGSGQLNGADRSLREEIRANFNRGPPTSGGPGRI